MATAAGAAVILYYMFGRRASSIDGVEDDDDDDKRSGDYRREEAFSATAQSPAVSLRKISELDPSVNEDEWGGADEVVEIGNGSPAKAEVESTEEVEVDSKLTELKRCLVDTFYGTELGFRGGSEVRAKVVELVNQLEAANPTPALTENLGLLDDN